MKFIYTGIIVIILIFLIYKIVLLYKSKVSYNLSKYRFTQPVITNDNIIPKIIWTYWNNLENVPSIVKKCIDTWYYHCNDYNIIILNNERFKQLTEIDINDALSISNNHSYQLTSDFVRLVVINMYGGIWMDASMICAQPLDWIHDIQQKNDYEFIGYRVPSQELQVIDSWFLAAVPNSTFMYDWMMEFLYALSFNSGLDYCRYVNGIYSIPFEFKITLPYLMIHLAAWKIRNDNPNKYNIYILESTDEGEPYYVTFSLCKGGNNANRAFSCLSRTRSIPDQRLIKLTGAMRHYVNRSNRRYKTNNEFLNYVLDKRY